MMRGQITQMISESYLLDPLMWWQFGFPLQLFVQQPITSLSNFRQQKRQKNISKACPLAVYHLRTFNSLISLIHCLLPSIN